MPHLSKILVPVDFSPPARAATRRAGALARHYGSELTLLHVDEIPFLFEAGERIAIRQADWESAVAADGARRRAELEVFESADLEGLTVRRLMRAGDPAQEVVRLAREDNADLIVMPTHGYGPIRRLLLGSVTAKVLHDAECAVWTEARNIEELERIPGNPRRVICGVRFGPETGGAVQWAAEFAAEFEAELIVAHAIPSPAAGNIYVHRWHEEAKQKAEERIEELISGLPVKPAVVILDGFAPDALSVAARDFEADLLVIGRDPSPGLLGRLNSEAYDIIRSSPCGVVSV